MVSRDASLDLEELLVAEPKVPGVQKFSETPREFRAVVRELAPAWLYVYTRVDVFRTLADRSVEIGPVINVS